ncbi:MAG TPA: GNAT family N-acetyltransferase [Streptosporangiaceae bacterium]|nr:GNAT family N-acetyltransferase [Streptosporangiaceae bacterium]
MTGMIRPVAPADLGAVRAIYNHAVVHTDATMDTEPKTAADFEDWFSEHQQRFCAGVLELADGTVAAYGSLSPFSRRGGYWPMTEVSFYVALEHQRQGAGVQLSAWLAEQAAQRGFVTLVAFVTSTNTGSVKVLERTGYQHTGRMFQAGHKLDRFVDLDVYQRFITGPAGADVP